MDSISRYLQYAVHTTKSGYPLLVLCLANIVVFYGHYSGNAIYPWDFYGGYHAMAFAWHLDGNWLNPPMWNNYGNYGFPWHLAMQNSAYYLPIQIIEWLNIPYTLHAAASLQSLHVLFGGVGCYLLLRQLGVEKLPALTAALAFHFSIGFYSNAQHVDIVRAYAFAPWVLLVTTSAFLKGPFRIGLATIIVWQFAVGSYPGILIAGVFIIPIFIIYQISLVPKRKNIFQYLLGLTIVFVLSIGLIGIKYGPALFYAEQLSIASGKMRPLMLEHYLTFLFRFDFDNIPYDITMRSYFIPVTIIALLFFANKVTKQIVIGFALLALALLLVTENSPVREWFFALPAFDSSRFHISDYRVFVHLSLVIIFASILQSMKTKQFHYLSIVCRALLAITLIVLVSHLAITKGFVFSHLRNEIVLFLCSVLVIAIVHKYLSWQILNASLIVLTLVSSFLYLRYATHVWQFTDYQNILEKRIYKKELDGLMSNTDRSGSFQERTERFKHRHKVAGNLGYYEQGFSQTGYDNGRRLRRNLTFQRLLAKPGNEELAKFMNKASSFILVSELPGSLEELPVFNIAAGQSSDVSLVQYSLDGSVFDVKLEQNMWLVENELFYSGWTAQICHAESDCVNTLNATEVEGYLRAWYLPAGSYKLATKFNPPEWRSFVGLFIFSFLCTAILLCWTRVKTAVIRILGKRIDEHGYQA